MTSHEDVVLAAWAPAGWGRIVVLLRQGVVIHKVVFSARAGATGIAEALGVGLGEPVADRQVVIPTADDLRASPFVAKVLRNGVQGLLDSSRKTLLPWGEIEHAEYRGRALNRGRLVLRARGGEHALRFLSTTMVIGDPGAVLTHYLGDRFDPGTA